MSSPIVSATWLYEHLETLSPVLVDCRFSLQDPTLGRAQYTASHLPGAYYMDLNLDLSSPVQQHGGRHPLPNPNRFSQALASMGLNVSSPGQSQPWVIAYDDSRFAFAARFWWLMRYYGYEQVALLDGGFKTWEALGYPVTSVVPEQQAGRFTPRLQHDWIVDIQQVQQTLDQPLVHLVDSREPPRYRGEVEPIDPIAGHIPGAVNLPWSEVTDSDGMVLSADQQRQRWQEIPPDHTTIVYCGSGVTACVNLLSRELAGLPMAKLYPGSWSDWCSYLIRDAEETTHERL